MNDVVADDVVDEIIASAAKEEVVAATAVDRVVAGIAINGVVVGVPGFQLVVVLGAAQNHRVAEEVIVADKPNRAIVQNID